MHRRQVLASLASGGSLLAAGCAVPGTEPGPFDFAIVNFRQQSFHVAFTLRHDGDVLVDGAVDVAARPSDEEYTVLRFADLDRVTNGDTIDAELTVDGELFETSYEVTCNRSENAGNELYFRIRDPEATTDSGMAFAGDEC
ncbi:hypothetical protein B4589_007995 [Halolamina sp. CBA1230]|uniref:hypothetical protein n=1 Tax=Halolamina sp. CBA1230 TaxID=1853690 RepID=UPI0009A143CA|nr:hypothetical protein [Halolamina sp. CBA1230]QKY20323.1 hypothetical protein B4589_007995 [Halolamina sp. CBA1230]